MPSTFFEGAKHASLYARYRPTTPATLIELIRSYISEQVSGPLEQAVDVGCGNGQATQLLSPHFGRVLGTDISAAQITEAASDGTTANVSYAVSPAESISLPNASSQLVMTVQAVHWFDMPTFWAEVGRVLSPGGALALVGYRLPAPLYRGKERLDVRELLAENYVKGLAEWIQPNSVDTYIDGYSHPRFQSPFTDQRRDESTFCDLEGTVADMIGYCSTWSGFQNMVSARGQQAGDEFLQQLQQRVLTLLGDGATADSAIQIRFRYFALLSRQVTKS